MLPPLFFPQSFTFLHRLFPRFPLTPNSFKFILRTRLNRKHKVFTVRFRPRDFLTVVAILIGTGKFKGFAVQPKRNKSLTAIAASG